MSTSNTNPHFTVHKLEEWTIVEFREPSLMDPVVLEQLGAALYHLVDAQDQRRVILDFEVVKYISSQAIGIVLTMHKKLAALPKSKLVLCGVNSKLMELIKITRLDRVLTLRPTQAEAVKVSPY